MSHLPSILAQELLLAAVQKKNQDLKRFKPPLPSHQFDPEAASPTGGWRFGPWEVDPLSQQQTATDGLFRKNGSFLCPSRKEGHFFQDFFSFFFWNYFGFSGSVAFRLFGFCVFYVGFTVPLFSHPLHCQFRCGRWLFGFLAFWLFGFLAFGGFLALAFRILMLPSWLPASSASQVPLWAPRHPPFD